MSVDKKTNVLSTLSAFNTLLNDFPSLLTIDFGKDGEGISTTISFLLDISSIFGIGKDKILSWLSSVLSDNESKATKGILTAIESAVKSILILYFKGIYTCDVVPLIPDEFLRYTQNDSIFTGQTNDGGVIIPLGSIDAFSLLKNIPTTPNGSIFYFDTPDRNNPNSPEFIYESTDFNAWLWYIINLAPDYGNKDYKNTGRVWDNRVLYKKAFNGNEGKERRSAFVLDKLNENSQAYYIKDVGVKKKIICADFQETGTKLENSNAIHVYGAKETYYKTGFLGKNKTVFEFNTDYILSLKLFDSKTILAQIVNAMLGFAGAGFGQISLEFSILQKKIEKTVEKVITKPLTSDSNEYFEFSEEEYNDIVNDATLRYNGYYDTKNETGELVNLDLSGVTEAIKKIDSADTLKDKENAVKYVVSEIANAQQGFQFGVNTPFVDGLEMIRNFIGEIIMQISLQVLSPKVMILFAINDYFLNGNGRAINIDINAFMESFWNIIKSCIVEIANLLVQSLFDFVIGYIRPILSLIARKLLLETIMYYKEELMNLLNKCSPPFVDFSLFNYGNFVIDNVNYADIIPQQTTSSNYVDSK